NLSGRSLKVELVSSAGKTAEKNAEQVVEDSRQVTLGPDGELMALRFEITPQKPGQRTYQLRVTPPSQDTDERDNSRSATVEIVERKNRVLLFASGAMLEFQF